MKVSAVNARRLSRIKALRREPVNQRGEHQQQDERRISCPVEHIARPKKIDLLDAPRHRQVVQPQHNPGENQERQRVERHRMRESQPAPGPATRSQGF